MSVWIVNQSLAMVPLSKYLLPLLVPLYIKKGYPMHKASATEGSEEGLDVHSFPSQAKRLFPL